jgi:glycosyltransferase involved in cell wall biosynthesis
MNEHLVSILIPVYNREGMVGRAIESALTQTHPALEVIVGDNRSTDQTFSVVMEYADRDSRVRIFQNPGNVGPVRNWLACLEKASGSLIRFLWSDDWMEPDFISRTLPFLQDPEVAFAYSPAEIVGEGRSVLSYAHFPTDIVFAAGEFIRMSIFRENVPHSPGCALFRRVDVQKSLMVDIPNRDGLDFSRYGAGNDLLLFLLPLLHYTRVAYVRSTRSYFQAHPGAFSCSHDLDLYYDWARLFFLRQKKDPGLTAQFKADLLLRRVRAARYKELLAATEGRVSMPRLFWRTWRIIAEISRRQSVTSPGGGARDG